MKRGVFIVLCSVLLLGVVALGWVSLRLYNQQLEKAEAEKTAAWNQDVDASNASVNQLCEEFWKRENNRPYYESLPRYNGNAPSKERLEFYPKGVESPLAKELPEGVAGYFLLSPTGTLYTPQAESPLRALFGKDSQLGEKLKDACSPKATSSELFAPNETVFHLVPAEAMEPSPSAPTRLEYEQSALRAVWMDDQLFFARTLKSNRGVFVQGLVLDVPVFMKMMLACTSDKLVDRRVIDLRDALPSIFPLKFIPGEGLDGFEAMPIDPVWYASLVLAWGVSLLSAVLVVYLMMSMLSLERRRASFVSAVTHELRTPLTTFTLYSEMLEDGLVAEDKKQEYYSILHRESLRLGHLIDNVLSFARLNQGTARVANDVGSGDEIFGQLAEKIRPRLEEAGFSLQVSIAQQVRVLPIKTDLLSLEQIINNLTDNAIKYGKGEQPRVQLTVQMKPRRLLIRFRDYGGGISSDVLKDIFTPFSRSAEASAGKLPGVGLGLALAHDAARFLGGELSVEATGPKGTCFLLVLPLN